MSIGIKSSKLFVMIISEALMIGLLGTIAGIILGILIQVPFAESGINLSVFAESLNSFGAGAIIYPETTIFNLLNLLIMVPIISILAALYPAYKSIKLEPVNAIRYL
jgi:ABC-type lipoprotein release transport system permease subunit